MGYESVRNRVKPLLNAGIVASCAALEAEALYSARSPEEYKTLRSQRAAIRTYLDTEERDWRQALEVQRELAARSQLRGCGIQDLFEQWTLRAPCNAGPFLHLHRGHRPERPCLPAPLTERGKPGLQLIQIMEAAPPATGVASGAVRLHVPTSRGGLPPRRRGRPRAGGWAGSSARGCPRAGGGAAGGEVGGAG